MSRRRFGVRQSPGAVDLGRGHAKGARLARSKAPEDWRTPKPGGLTICILAGGRSRRMGRDKRRLQLGGRTMLGQIRSAARAMGLPVRVIRRDRVPRCGPLGGVYTALRSTRAQAVLFLACDMPFVTVEVMRVVLGTLGLAEGAGGVRRAGRVGAREAVFMRSRAGAGFPFALRQRALAAVTEQINRGEFSLQALAQILKAKIIRPPRRLAWQLRNVNTPHDWKEARRLSKRGPLVSVRLC